ncbi:hypothetical protein [Litorimonas sp.]|uniref:hypothetical protein n=1 Tax=Litorimonas sp. TaxID=1892381 RepID=UPI003A8863BB
MSDKMEKAFQNYESLTLTAAPADTSTPALLKFILACEQNAFKAGHQARAEESGCSCDDVDFGTYTETVLLAEHPTMKGYFDRREKEFGKRSPGVCVDACLALEVTRLWNEGIGTLGCCCGHNKAPSFINIFPDDMSKALALGYEIYRFPNDPEREDTVVPKSVLRKNPQRKHNG